MEIVHSPKWAPGELIVTATEQNFVQTLNTSMYGPISVDYIFDFSSAKSPSRKLYSLKFSKPYNPQRLIELLQSEFVIENAEPNRISGGSSNVEYNPTAP